MIRMENQSDGHSKFYEIYFNSGKTVSVRYGAIGAPGTIIKKSFSTSDAAYAWKHKQVIDKMSGGYETVDTANDVAYWYKKYTDAQRRLDSIRSAAY